jgi:hypothetical protein
MDTTKLQAEQSGPLRTFKICLDHPHQPTTILGVVRRIAAQQAITGGGPRRVPVPRRFGAFA